MLNLKVGLLTFEVHYLTLWWIAALVKANLLLFRITLLFLSLFWRCFLWKLWLFKVSRAPTFKPIGWICYFGTSFVAWVAQVGWRSWLPFSAWSEWIADHWVSCVTALWVRPISLDSRLLQLEQMRAKQLPIEVSLIKPVSIFVFKVHKLIFPLHLDQLSTRHIYGWDLCRVNFSGVFFLFCFVLLYFFFIRRLIDCWNKFSFSKWFCMLWNDFGRNFSHLRESF